ncbi:MAG: hypothetical protein A2X61_15815 [Ignavibacteria bacterium GWB2_35_12]|nr:MAG: hypothetical protein A2X63_10775 [Ignavibacteria bacterium GWA2_35_8]OGU40841.1 MAG: hypothetical protein A2X61_15815 [Ignavibacteria bacterium GWB2_35_12]OGU87133.1 MAG: hypothetical protein A2220_08190 [Ignavibacteria bacterium RIFOXYA2_FULL_35_10]OGV24668.1 MAG: hypothetical protein A2475_14590 [Ignavibacteria bacterium RIFOXYC2_FULL_35_21]
MKKHILNYLPLSVAGFFLVVFILYSQTAKTADEKDSAEKKQLNELYKKYDKSLFKAIFSSEELRPYAIIQIDKLSDSYKNEWTSPEAMYEMLNKKEREYLLNQIAVYLHESKDQNRSNRIFDKLKYWCIADIQFSLITDKFGFYNEDIFRALMEIANTKQFFIREIDGQPIDLKSLSKTQTEKIYSNAMNYISSLSLKDQLKCYAEVYSQLSNISMR